MQSEQQIPYVKVVNKDGTTTEYVDIESGLNPATIDPVQLKEMDCITCHNRITHLVSATRRSRRSDAGAQGDRSGHSRNPLARRRGLERDLRHHSRSNDGIAALKNFYQTTYPDYYNANSAKVDAAIATLQEDYQNSTFPEQKSDWTTHPNNVGHQDTPGCFRCHDGKHLNDKQEADSAGMQPVPLDPGCRRPR